MAFTEMDYINVGGGLNPTIVQDIYSKAALNKTISINISKMYLFTADYIRDGYDNAYEMWIINNGALDILKKGSGVTSQAYVGTPSLSGSTLTYTRPTATANVHAVLYQLN